MSDTESDEGPEVRRCVVVSHHRLDAAAMGHACMHARPRQLEQKDLNRPSLPLPICLPAGLPCLQTLIKLIFVGDSGVGKSALIERMFSNRFDPQLPATIGR